MTTVRRRTPIGSKANVDSDDTATRLADRTKTRFANPRRTVCSCTTSGQRHKPAAMPTGTATYPPVDKITSGANSATTDRASATPNGTRAMSLAFSAFTIPNTLRDRRTFPVADRPERDLLGLRDPGLQPTGRPDPQHLHGTPLRHQTRLKGPQRRQRRIRVPTRPTTSHQQPERLHSHHRRASVTIHEHDAIAGLKRSRTSTNNPNQG